MYMYTLNKVREFVNCLCIDKQKWFQVRVKIARTCHATGLKCLCCTSFSYIHIYIDFLFERKIRRKI